MIEQGVYPSTDELMPDSLLARIPASLEVEIKTRYKKHGPEYLTDDLYDDRRVNSCMYNDSVQLAKEEVVDAVFNVLVLIFKQRRSGYISDNSYTVLMGLMEIYSLLAVTGKE